MGRFGYGPKWPGTNRRPQTITEFPGCHDLPKRTGTDEMDRYGPNGTKRTFENTEMDLYGYRNGLKYRNGPEQTSAHTEKNFNENQKQ